MIRLITTIFVLFLSSAIYAEDDKWNINPTEDKSAKFGVYIPKNIHDAHKELDKMLSEELKNEIKSGTENDMNMYHFDLGLWMRNNWALWAGSDLSKWFNSRGIYHPDDMSGILLDSYFHHLNNEPLGLEKQFEFYIRYWKIREEPQKFPCDNGKVLFGLHHSENGKQYYYHVAQCGDSAKYMIYDFDKGWSEPTKEILNRIEELKKEEGLISAPLVKPN